MPQIPELDEAAIRAARTHSNRSIARRNLLGVGDSLAEDYVGIIGDGTFVSSRKEYLRLFKLGFDSRDGLTYERVAERIDISCSDPLAAEHGHWIARTSKGLEVFTGVYTAMWRRGEDGWKLRSEIFVTLTAS